MKIPGWIKRILAAILWAARDAALEEAAKGIGKTVKNKEPDEP